MWSSTIILAEIDIDNLNIFPLEEYKNLTNDILKARNLLQQSPQSYSLLYRIFFDVYLSIHLTMHQTASKTRETPLFCHQMIARALIKSIIRHHGPFIDPFSLFAQNQQG